MVYRRESLGNNREIFKTSALIETMPWRKEGEKNHRACAEVSYDSEALYVRMRAFETELIAERHSFGDPVCRDSCLEFFFAPLNSDNSYFNFEVNPLGTMYVGFSSDGTRSGSRLLSEISGETEMFGCKTSVGQSFWEVSYRIPYPFIRRFVPAFPDPVPRSVLRCNFYTCCDDNTVPYYSVWNSIDSQYPDYHRPDCFGELQFE